jgi:nitric oxide reductase FlRd-NAD(+) reductase
MSNPIVIIGSGFAAYQLVKNIRKHDSAQHIMVITADSGDDYAKPDLSHVFSKEQSADDLVKMHGDEFATQQGITLLKNSRVEAINAAEKSLLCNGEKFAYHKLVLATGANAFVPPTKGNGSGEIITLNSLKEYAQYQPRLAAAKSVLVIGAGLIGTEIAMDLASAGRKVIVTDLATRMLPSLLPDFISSQLYQTLSNHGVTVELDTQVTMLEDKEEGIEVTLNNGNQYQVGCVISAVGLRPNIKLAADAGLTTGRGIVVDSQLQTSQPDIFALGDCAEIEGRVLPFLQPILLSSIALAKTLLGQPSSLKLPAMMIKVKTPLIPMQLSGNTTSADATWHVDTTDDGMTAKAINAQGSLMGFVVVGSHMNRAFPLLRQLPAIL